MAVAVATTTKKVNDGQTPKARSQQMAMMPTPNNQLQKAQAMMAIAAMMFPRN